MREERGEELGEELGGRWKRDVRDCEKGFGRRNGERAGERLRGRNRDKSWEERLGRGAGIRAGRRDCEEETGIRAGRRDWGEEPGLVRPGCQDESLLVSLIYHPTKYITNLSPVPTVSFPH